MKSEKRVAIILVILLSGFNLHMLSTLNNSYRLSPCSWSELSFITRYVMNGLFYLVSILLLLVAILIYVKSE